ncbi:SPOR domain-containing protein [Hyphomicrobium sp. 99]|uniref:SPOR domain-containing protein n=1 Tax=Hyphomicrobium sp. 99 TaxID=1163419 RepID=UPI0005F84C97|nr:SPOR domain-containing protein [Hyphomicrobium sp. 99]
MSSQNAFPGPNASRLAARPNAQANNTQPPWVNPQATAGRPQQQHPDNGNGWPGHQQPAPANPSFPQPGFGAHAPEQQSAFGQWSELQPTQAPNRGNYGGYQQQTVAEQPDPYAPQFEPYVPPSRPSFAPQQPAQSYGNQQQQPAPQWPARDLDPHGFDNGGYAAPGFAPQPARQQAAHAQPTFGQQQYHENELSAADWAGPHDTFAPDSYQQNRGDAHLGFGQAEGGEVEPVYAEEDLEYEDEEEAPRGRRPLMIVAALIGAIVIGGGMAYGYKKISGVANPQGDPPVIKSAEFPSKTKPADAGGKQFPYSDTKIMGRLGDGTSSAQADEANNSQGAAPENSDNQANASPSEDSSGARKVSTLVVGRDGSIQAPPPAPEPERAPPPGDTGVPGTSLVDFGQHQGMGIQPPVAVVSGPPVRPTPLNAEPAPAAAAVSAKKVKPVKIAKVNSVDTTGSVDDAAEAPPAVPTKKLKKVARAQPTVETDATADAPPVVASSGGGAGFVAVLASIPRSGTSRIDALKRFADMQQKYGSALAGKTPDVASATLTKGAYDRLVVGPPGSREEASNVCSQLKAQGYKDCWVTSY